jgi:hypothetical protein
MSIFGNIMSAIFGHGGQTPLRGSHRGPSFPRYNGDWGGRPTATSLRRIER